MADEMTDAELDDEIVACLEGTVLSTDGLWNGYFLNISRERLSKAIRRLRGKGRIVTAGRRGYYRVPDPDAPPAPKPAPPTRRVRRVEVPKLAHARKADARLSRLEENLPALLALNLTKKQRVALGFVGREAEVQRREALVTLELVVRDYRRILDGLMPTTTDEPLRTIPMEDV